MMAHEDYKAMIPARSLSTLDADDDRVLSSHLAECPECRRELDEWNAVAASLALAAPVHEPSPQVREKILSKIASEIAPTETRVVPFIVPKKNVWSSLGSFGAIAAGVLFVVMLGSVFMLWRENRSMQAQLAQQATEMRDLQEKVGQQRRMSQMFFAPGSQMAELLPTSAAPGAKAMVAFDKTGHAMLIARGLPAAPAGKAYQLWYIVGTTPMPGRVFKMDREGNGMLEDEIPAAALKAAVFAVTMEPEQGVEKPTGAILLSSSL
jgi:anti-sigma-K factor RskA